MQLTFLYLLDRVPSNPQMHGHVLDRHVPRQFQHISFKGVRVTQPLIGKIHPGLACLPAARAQQPLNRQLDQDRFASDGKGAEAASHQTRSFHLERSAASAAKSGGILFDSETDGIDIKADCDLLVAANTPTVIQETGGHEPVSFLKLGNSRNDSHVHVFSTIYASTG
jgi:hypothetical protein